MEFLSSIPGCYSPERSRRESHSNFLLTIIRLNKLLELYIYFNKVDGLINKLTDILKL
jgi:hypothetical protein